MAGSHPLVIDSRGIAFVDASSDAPVQLYPAGANVYYGTDQRTLTVSNGTLVTSGQTFTFEVWLVSSGQATVDVVELPPTSNDLSSLDASVASLQASVAQRMLPPTYHYNSAAPNLGATQTITLDPLTEQVLVGTLNLNLTVTCLNRVQGARARIVGVQDGTGSHTVTLTDGTTAMAVTVVSTASAKFTIEIDFTDALTARVRATSASAVTFMNDWVMVLPTPPNPGIRENRVSAGVDKSLIGGFTDTLATGTVNAADTATAVPELAGYANYVAGVSGAGLSLSGFSPVPFVDEATAATTPTALVNSKGELTNQQSSKARVLQTIGPPVKPGYTPNGTSDDPYTAFSPNFTVTDAGGGATNGQVYTGQLWDLWRFRPAGTAWAANARTASRTITGIATTNGSKSVTFGAGQITSSDTGMTLEVAGLAANTYVVSVAGNTATMSANATGTGAGVTGTLKPTNPADAGFTMECQNASRVINLASSPGYPIDRYPSATTTAQLAVCESAAWGATATKLSYLPLMVLEEDIRRYKATGLIPKHAVGISFPHQLASHRWPAQANDPATSNVGYLSSSHLEEGMRYRLNMGKAETPAASMPLTDAAIEALALHPVAEMVAKQAARYGFVLWDHAGTVTMRSQPEVVNYFNGTPAYLVFKGFPWSSLEVLNTGTQTAPNP